MSFIPYPSQTPPFSNKMLQQNPTLQSTNQPQPRLCYYIERTNGMFVPLVPADELPFNVCLQGVPRVLNADQTFGMQQVGMMLPPKGLTFNSVDDSIMQRSTSQQGATSHSRSQSGSESRNSLTPDSWARQALVNSNAANSLANLAGSNQFLSQLPTSAHEASPDWRKTPKSDPQAIIDAIVGTTCGAEAAGQIGYLPKSDSILPPSGNKPDQDKKEFCTHWIRHGECDYTQQGCLYKHEMPDKAMLQKIGFRSVPRWWLEKTQTTKIGGERASVGPIVKPSEWLKTKGGDDSDEEDDLSEKETAIEAKQCAGKGVGAITQASVISLGADRKQSVTGDLINFEPVTPAPAKPANSMSTPTGSSYNFLSSVSTPPTQSDVDSKQEQAKKASSPAKVFVPAGESAEKHIAEAKKRSTRSPSNRNRSAPNPEEPIDRQIENLQKSKQNGGLMASKHALPVEHVSKIMEQTADTQKRDPKSGCRVRRPATSSPAASGSKDASVA